jgi:hypothetical protein
VTEDKDPPTTVQLPPDPQRTAAGTQSYKKCIYKAFLRASPHTYFIYVVRHCCNTPLAFSAEGHSCDHRVVPHHRQQRLHLHPPPHPSTSVQCRQLRAIARRSCRRERRGRAGREPGGKPAHAAVSPRPPNTSDPTLWPRPRTTRTPRKFGRCASFKGHYRQSQPQFARFATSSGPFSST